MENPEYEIIHRYSEFSETLKTIAVYNILRDQIDEDEKVEELKSVSQKNKLSSEKESLIDREIENCRSFDKLLGQSERVRKLKREIYCVKDSNCKVLICGESGTGKSLIAHILHETGLYKDKHLVSVNVGALQKDLIESTLFGSVKGAFTDAVDRKGLMSLADGGTLFLDEIAELPVSCQPKLLRAIEEGVYRKVGSDKEEKVSCRFIFATNQNLKDLVRKKLFREDLYYRIVEFCINVPTLNERKDDILLLAEHFLSEANSKSTLEKKYFSNEAKEKLLEYSWPGNIRELKAAVNVSTIYSQNRKIMPEDIQFI